MILSKQTWGLIIMYGLALPMKLMKEHMCGLQGNRLVIIPIGLQGNQTRPRTMAVCIIILESGGMIMALIVTVMFLKYLHYPPH